MLDILFVFKLSSEGILSSQLEGGVSGCEGLELFKLQIVFTAIDLSKLC